MYCCDMDVCNDQCQKTTVTTPTLKPSASATKPLTVKSTTSKITLSSTQASTITPTFTTQTLKTTKISTLQTTAISTPQSTTIPTKQTTAIPTLQSTTIPTKQTTTIPTLQSTTILTRQAPTHLKATTSYQATLSSPIITDVTRNPQVVHHGDKVHITCTAIGYPPPIYNFKFRDGPLPRNAHVTGNTLTIENFVSANVGNYECIASNSKGTGNYGVHLQAFL